MLRKKTLHSKKKSLSENRDEIHARLEINSDMYEKKSADSRDRTSENGNPLEVDEISLRHCQWYDHG